MEKLKKMWQSFAEKNPKIAEWVREGGLFFLVSTLITVLKMILLVFLPDMSVPHKFNVFLTSTCLMLLLYIFSFYVIFFSFSKIEM